MKRTDYDVLLKYIKDNETLPLEDIIKGLKLIGKSKWKSDALLSICLFHYQQRTKLKYPEQSTKEKSEAYFSTYTDNLKKQEKGDGKVLSSTLLDMSYELGISPALLARLIIKEYLCQQNYAHQNDGDSLHVKNEVSLLLRNPFLIQDKLLSANVRQCVLHDMGYGPVTDGIKHMVGLEHEHKLLDHVKRLAIPFQDENELRKLGYDKTPDIKLEIPIYIKGQVVCWIESKASFGCPEAHKIYLNEQYYSYWNRFGPGLVIYWYGFVDDLADEMLENEIILMDRFPEDSEIVQFQPKSVKTGKVF